MEYTTGLEFHGNMRLVWLPIEIEISKSQDFELAMTSRRPGTTPVEAISSADANAMQAACIPRVHNNIFPSHGVTQQTQLSENSGGVPIVMGDTQNGDGIVDLVPHSF